MSCKCCTKMGRCSYTFSLFERFLNDIDVYLIERIMKLDPENLLNRNLDKLNERMVDMRMFILREFWIYPNVNGDRDGMFLCSFQVFLQSMQTIHLRTAPLKDLNRFLANLDKFFEEYELMMQEVQKIAQTAKHIHKQPAVSSSKVESRAGFCNNCTECQKDGKIEDSCNSSNSASRVHFQVAMGSSCKGTTSECSLSVAFNVTGALEDWSNDEPPPLMEDFGDEFDKMEDCLRGVMGDFAWKSFVDEGTKLGIAPLMLAAMNGHTNIVKLLIESNADVNQCIETNRNTALTLACFQGRTECVRVLVEKGANLEWRSKNGLNAMMEAANGGFYEIGKILVEAGAEVNCASVPSTKDTPLTIAAEKGHAKFVQLLIDNGAALNIRNKKGASPLWLACQNGHLDCVRALVASGTVDVDARDNRQMSCILIAFKRGHENIVKLLVDHIHCYPSEEEMSRYCKDVKLNGNNTYLLTTYERCKKSILDAKHKKEAEADAKAQSLLEELDLQQKAKEGQRAKKRDKKKQKKKTGAKSDEILDSGPNSNAPSSAPSRSTSPARVPPPSRSVVQPPVAFEDEEDDDGQSKKRKKKKGKKGKTEPEFASRPAVKETFPVIVTKGGKDLTTAAVNLVKKVQQDAKKAEMQPLPTKTKSEISKSKSDLQVPAVASSKRPSTAPPQVAAVAPVSAALSDEEDGTTTDENAPRLDLSADDEWVQQKSKSQKSSNFGKETGSQERFDSRRAPLNSLTKQEGGWREVVGRSRRFKVPTAAIARIIGKGGANINAIRASTCAHIEIEKNKPGINDRLITVKGTGEAVAEAYHIIQTLVDNPDRDLEDLLSESKRESAALTHAMHAIGELANGKSSASAREKETGRGDFNRDVVVEQRPGFIRSLPTKEVLHPTTHSTQVFTNSQMNKLPSARTSANSGPPENYSSIVSQKRSSIHSTSSKESSQSLESSAVQPPRAASAHVVDRDTTSPAFTVSSCTSTRGSPSSVPGVSAALNGASICSQAAAAIGAASSRAVVNSPASKTSLQATSGESGKISGKSSQVTSPSKPPESLPLLGTLYNALVKERERWNPEGGFESFFANDTAASSAVPTSTFNPPKGSLFAGNSFGENRPSQRIDELLSSYPSYQPGRPASLPQDSRGFSHRNGFLSPTAFPTSIGNFDSSNSAYGAGLGNGVDVYEAGSLIPEMSDMWSHNNNNGFEHDNSKFMSLAATMAKFENVYSSSSSGDNYGMGSQARRMPFGDTSYDLGFPTSESMHHDHRASVPLPTGGSRLIKPNAGYHHSDGSHNAPFFSTAATPPWGEPSSVLFNPMTYGNPARAPSSNLNGFAALTDPISMGSRNGTGSVRSNTSGELNNNASDAGKSISNYSRERPSF